MMWGNHTLIRGKGRSFLKKTKVNYDGLSKNKVIQLKEGYARRIFFVYLC